MKAFLKEYWFIIVPLAGFAVWLITINTRLFDSTEQKVHVIKTIEDGPTAGQRMRAYMLDSINKTEAIKSRRLRDSTFRAQDSLRKIHDSTMLDYVQRNAVQINQIKEQLKKDSL